MNKTRLVLFLDDWRSSKSSSSNVESDFSTSNSFSGTKMLNEKSKHIKAKTWKVVTEGAES